MMYTYLLCNTKDEKRPPNGNIQYTLFCIIFIYQYNLATGTDFKK